MSTVIAGLKVHPAAEVFPLLEGEAFSALCEDIKTNGLREPVWRIWLDGGLGNGTREAYILDGRNRLRACERIRVKPDFRDYDGTDPVAHVLSLNLHRRHLDESQRGMVAARIANLRVGRPCPSAISPIGHITRLEDAANRLNVGKRTVVRAKAVVDRGAPELAELVERGELALTAADDLLCLPKEKQQEIVASGQEAIRGAVSDIRKSRAAKGNAQSVRVEQTKFTERQRKIKELRASGKLVREIATALGMSQSAISHELSDMGLSENSPAVKLWSDIEHVVSTMGAVTIRLEQLTEALIDDVEMSTDPDKLSQCARELRNTEKALRAFRAVIEEKAKANQ